VNNHVKKIQGCIANEEDVGKHPKIAILKQLQSHFKAKRKTGVGTPFPRVPPHYTPEKESPMWCSTKFYELPNKRL